MLLYNVTEEIFKDVTPKDEFFQNSPVSAGLEFDPVSKQGIILGGGFMDQTTVSDKVIIFKYDAENATEPITVIRSSSTPYFNVMDPR
ncbi:BEM_collapsed_G0049800.mRNA.1.CDS.1 [Saccharomyces cerevisiae]|nr:BEM_collapsed_G0049800.mRNA.1.CDS.1 [Saccharomyces cerevisiae]